MKGSLAIVLALLGLAMFSGSLWVQREWLPCTEMSRDEVFSTSIALETRDAGADSGHGLHGSAPDSSQPDQSWRVEHVIAK